MENSNVGRKFVVHNCCVMCIVKKLHCYKKPILAISKKNIKRAVDRALMKRRVRYSLNLLKEKEKYLGYTFFIKSNTKIQANCCANFNKKQ